MRNPGRQQSDGRELVRLRQLRFQFYTFRDVVDNNQPSDHVELRRDQRRNRDVKDSRLLRGCMEPKLVQVVNAGTLTLPVKRFYERRRENLVHRPGTSL